MAHCSLDFAFVSIHTHSTTVIVGVDSVLRVRERRSADGDVQRCGARGSHGGI